MSRVIPSNRQQRVLDGWKFLCLINTSTRHLAIKWIPIVHCQVIHGSTSAIIFKPFIHHPPPHTFKPTPCPSCACVRVYFVECRRNKGLGVRCWKLNTSFFKTVVTHTNRMGESIPRLPHAHVLLPLRPRIGYHLSPWHLMRIETGGRV